VTPILGLTFSMLFGIMATIAAAHAAGKEE
jgi:hypothetical protein